MRHKHSLPFFLILLCFPSYGHAQLWSGILASSRATDWTKAGVKGGIPSANWTQCGPTISAYTGTAATINNAIAACGTNQYVQLGAGTFNLSSGIQISKSNVVLRGMGADQTFIVSNGFTSCGSGTYGVILACSGYPTEFTANWTAGYSQGTSQITLDSSSSLSTGMFIVLDQADDASDGWPSTGDIYVCESATPGCSSSGGGGSPDGDSRPGRAETEFHEVTAISGGGPYTISITPPIINPNWRSGQNPGAYWFSPTTANVGVENLSLDFTGAHNTGTTGVSGISLAWVRDSWVRGVRLIDTSSVAAQQIQSVIFDLAFRCSLVDSYLYGPNSTPTNIAGFLTRNAGQFLMQNNIVHNGVQPVIINGAGSANVIAYNFSPSEPDGGVFAAPHGAGDFEDLWEGNIGTGFESDAVHGSHFMQTQFRNRWRNQNTTAYYRQVDSIMPNSRFHNVIANVLGGSEENTYESSQIYNRTTIFMLGYQDYVNSDSDVLRTIMRWGNWDSVTNAVRWCGNSSDTGWSTTCGSTSEIPSAITNFSNPVPGYGDTGAGQSPIPASFYLTSRPSWWPSAKPWPAIGPDVAGGNIANTAGHAYTNPAADCYLNVMHGRAGGSGGPLSFNAGTCYPPAPPTEVEAVAD
jgi:hypothetical protein